MTIAGLALPALSEYDPPQAGEGSIDPMGLAVISDRLADRLVPGLRARMQRVRFVTAMAAAAIACEELLDEPAGDDWSTPQICFEWLVIESFARRLKIGDLPPGVPGIQKARAVQERGERLSRETYLKGPTVFGFHGVYRPFAVDSGVLAKRGEPASRTADIVRAWESSQGFIGFTEDVPGSPGSSLRRRIRDEVLRALRSGRCSTAPGSQLFGQLAVSLNPDSAHAAERSALRSLVLAPHHEVRRELAMLLALVDEDGSEAELLRSIRPRTSGPLGAIIDAVLAYEELAARIDAVFRTLCAASYAAGAQPLTPASVREHETLTRCARELPGRFAEAAASIDVIDVHHDLESRLGEFAIKRSPEELVEVVMAHHQQVQASKQASGDRRVGGAANGKRSWFDPLRDGWVVRSPYAISQAPTISAGGKQPSFVHPVRVDALRRFLGDTAA